MKKTHIEYLLIILLLLLIFIAGCDKPYLKRQLSDEFKVSCETAENSYEKDNCYLFGAIASGDTELCKNVEKAPGAVTMTLNDLIACEIFVYIEHSDIQGCKELSGSMKNYCLSEVAKNTDNQEICNDLDEDPLYKKGTCLLAVAIENKNKELFIESFNIINNDPDYKDIYGGSVNADPEEIYEQYMNMTQDTSFELEYEDKFGICNHIKGEDMSYLCKTLFQSFEEY